MSHIYHEDLTPIPTYILVATVAMTTSEATFKFSWYRHEGVLSLKHNSFSKPKLVLISDYPPAMKSLGSFQTMVVGLNDPYLLSR